MQDQYDKKARVPTLSRDAKAKQRHDSRLCSAPVNPCGFFGETCAPARGVIEKKSPGRRGLSWMGETLAVSGLTVTPTGNAAFGSARFCFTVPNFPIARPARYRIATLTLICCGTM